MLQQSYVYILFPHDKHEQGPHTYYNRKIKKQKEEENTDPIAVLNNQNHMIKEVIKIR